MYNKWGGNAPPSDGGMSDDDHSKSNMDIDRASVKSLDETQQSWLLGAGGEKKKKGIDLGCVIISRRVCCVLVCLLVFVGFIAGIAVLIVKTLPKHHKHPPAQDNYTQALHKALLFFDAQKSGPLPKGYNISWRGNSGLKDGLEGANTGPGSMPTNLVGGYYDAGDNIKFTFPTAYALSLLSWSVIEYKAKYVAADEYEHVRDLIKWGTDWMLKTYNYTNSNKTEISYIFAQVGSSSLPSKTVNDHYCWERPESTDFKRTAYSVAGGSDLAAEMAAAMASASIVFNDNSAYSKKLLNASLLLLDFAEDLGKRRRYSADDADAALLYNSTTYWDDFLWANAWLYYASGNVSYLERATTAGLAKNANAQAVGSRYYGVFSWDNKLFGAQVLLTKLYLMHSPPFPYQELMSQYYNETNLVMCSFLPKFKSWNVTAGGLYMFNYGNPAPLQYNANAAFLASLYADYLTTGDIPGWPCGPGAWYQPEDLKAFAQSQMDYILGKNPMNMSYVVGFGTRYPLHVHHRAASIPTNKVSYGCTGGFQFRDSLKPNPHVITGAMVAGPDKKDKFLDRRINFTYTEPSLVGNAGLTAALVSLSEVTEVGVDANTLFDRLPSYYVASPPPPAPWKPHS